MGERNLGLIADPLFVGATRPPMRWGVTYSALLANGVFTMEVFLLTKNLLTLGLALPVHGLCARDARFFDLALPLGPHSNPGAARERTLLEVEQLRAALTRPPGRERAAPDLTALHFREVRGGVAVMSARAWQATLRRELSAAERIPYSAHVSPHVVRTTLGDYVQVFRLGGASFECGDDDTLNSWHERLNIFWRNVASPQLALWVHVIRRWEVTAPKPGEAGFAGALETKYRARLAHQTLMVNELYVSTVYRPTAGIAPGLASTLRFCGRIRPVGVNCRC